MKKKRLEMIDYRVQIMDSSNQHLLISNRIYLMKPEKVLLVFLPMTFLSVIA